ncbi:hypothetical protein [Aliarcobacter butzleri]|uniref:hypothetical protein n=1 Tax=Aliarcobacter butzleri TaxID=28197 RepID=UPI001587B986|nr:hypothetical protein [Aliarcobacter butzleri]NUW29002.1 hypothetical protein [Aliarcobacter butzleri]
MLTSLISAISSKVLAGVIVTLVAIVFALGVHSYFISSRLDSTQEDLTKKEAELTKKDEELKKAKGIYEKNLALQTEIATKKAITQESKKEVVKATSKVQEELIKRGEIKQDEKETDFIIVEF